MGKIKNKNLWHPCYYEGLKCQYPSDDKPPFEEYVNWLDKYGNIEFARMKEDAEDHFYPNTSTIKEENIIAWRYVFDDFGNIDFVNLWIPTHRKLPPKKEFVLTCDVDGDCEVLELDDNWYNDESKLIWLDRDVQWVAFNRIVAWRPIEPYIKKGVAE